MAVPASMLQSESFLLMLKAAGLGDDALEAFKMLDEARQMVADGEMEKDEYEKLEKGVQMQILHLAAGGSTR